MVYTSFAHGLHSQSVSLVTKPCNRQQTKRQDNMEKNIGKTVLTAVMASLMASCGTATKTANGSKTETTVAQTEQSATKTAQTATATAQTAKPTITLAEQFEMVKMNNTFALNLFNSIDATGSTVVSPLSVTYLMSILANGADGLTRSEILKTIGWEGKTTDDVNTVCQMLMDKAAQCDPSTVVNMANYVAVNKGYTPVEKFASTIRDCYKADVESLDFASKDAVKHINEWCNRQTEGMIPQIVQEMQPNAVAYLMNAIYFNGTWTEKFNKKNTKDERFKGYTRDIKQVKMMHQEAKFMYMDNETYSAVKLPYGNRSYDMTVLLPNEGKSIAEMMETLDANGLTGIGRSMDECIVDLKLPRFSTEMELPLNDIISKLGAPSMFKQGVADFKNFASGNIFISKMLQKAKIEVSEEGTKAAAVTAAMMVGASLVHHEPRRVEFHANRPFVYMITDDNGAILFLGQYTGD